MMAKVFDDGLNGLLRSLVIELPDSPPIRITPSPSGVVEVKFEDDIGGHVLGEVDVPDGLYNLALDLLRDHEEMNKMHRNLLVLASSV